jgi:hypothetical protein
MLLFVLLVLMLLLLHLPFKDDETTPCLTLHRHIFNCNETVLNLCTLYTYIDRF